MNNKNNENDANHENNEIDDNYENDEIDDNYENDKIDDNYEENENYENYEDDEDINKYTQSELNIKLYNALDDHDYDLVTEMIKKGADVNCKKYQSDPTLMYSGAKYENYTPILKCDGTIDNIKYLVEHGANVNCSDAYGWTPLMNACDSNNLEVVKYLVEHGANINSNDFKGNSILTLFIERKKIHNGVDGEEYEIFKYLVDHGADVNHYGNHLTPLTAAIHCKTTHIYVRYLVEHGANVNYPNSSGKTPLMIAINNIDIDIDIGTRLELIKYLIDHGAKLNVRDDKGITALIYACNDSDINIIKYLVEHAANVNIANDKGETPLIIACCNQDIDNVKYLVEHGAKVNHVDEKGKTALMHCCDSNLYHTDNIEIIDYLLSNGANIDNNIYKYICSNSDYNVLIFIHKYMEKHYTNILIENIHKTTTYIETNKCITKNKRISNVDNDKINMFYEFIRQFTRNYTIYN